MEARKFRELIRPAAGAGHFYPAEPGLLRTVVQQLLNSVEDIGDPGQVTAAPKALIVPHAAYVYSGPVAARAYAGLRPLAGKIRRVVLLGPAHRVGFYGMAAPDAQFFETPLGTIPVDREALDQACALPMMFRFDAAHQPEHCLEVQLPFLQEVLGEGFSLVPVVVGGGSAGDVARVLETLWGGPETLVLVSSDLSNHLDYEAARRMDERTRQAIESLDDEAIEAGMACGRVPIQGLLRLARARGLKAQCLDLRSSGDTAGPRERVVGYGAFAFS
jgi:AmmeMemoRadiSam system protein B